MRKQPVRLLREEIIAKDLRAQSQATKQPFRCDSGLVDAVHHATACPKGSDNQQRYQDTYHVVEPTFLRAGIPTQKCMGVEHDRLPPVAVSAPGKVFGKGKAGRYRSRLGR